MSMLLIRIQIGSVFRIRIRFLTENYCTVPLMNLCLALGGQYCPLNKMEQIGGFSNPAAWYISFDQYFPRILSLSTVFLADKQSNGWYPATN